MRDLQEVRALARNGRARKIRLRANLSLADVAIVAEVSPSTVYRWEMGDRRPTGAAAVRYLKALREIQEAGTSIESHKRRSPAPFQSQTDGIPSGYLDPRVHHLEYRLKRAEKEIGWLLAGMAGAFGLIALLCFAVASLVA